MGRILTVNEAAQIVGMCRETLRKVVSTGELPASNVAPNKDGKRAAWRILEEDLLAWIKSRKSEQK